MKSKNQIEPIISWPYLHQAYWKHERRVKAENDKELIFSFLVKKRNWKNKCVKNVTANKAEGVFKEMQFSCKSNYYLCTISIRTSRPNS